MIRKHGLQESVGIARLHNHFLIEDGEKVIAHLGKREVHFHVQRGEEGKWIPTQFVQVRSDRASHLFLEDLYQVGENHSFALEMWKHICRSGDQKRLGLVLNLSKFVGIDGNRFSLMEETDENQRLQRMYLESKEKVEKSIITAFHSTQLDGCDRFTIGCSSGCRAESSGHHGHVHVTRYDHVRS